MLAKVKNQFLKDFLKLPVFLHIFMNSKPSINSGLVSLLKRLYN